MVEDKSPNKAPLEAGALLIGVGSLLNRSRMLLTDDLGGFIGEVPVTSVLLSSILRMSPLPPPVEGCSVEVLSFNRSSNFMFSKLVQSNAFVMEVLTSF